jgi:hypothetical protein
MAKGQRWNKLLLKERNNLKTILMKFLHKLFHWSSEKLNLFMAFDILDVSSPGHHVSLLRDNLNIGIVIQGPIFPRATIEICKFYKKIYPDVYVVLSTWEGENTSEIEDLCDSRFIVIKSKKPDSPGQQNINMQIASSKAGIKHLVNFECTHILKTRTDILLGNSSFLNYLVWMHSKGKQNSLVFSSFGSCLFRLFSPTDQVVFGAAPDMERFWAIDLIPANQGIDMPEKYLFTKYIESHGHKTLETLDNYFVALRDFSVIADHEQLGQIWNKGAYTALNYRWRGEKFPNPMTQITSWHWELLQKDFSYLKKISSELT